ncbi:MAG: flagellin FliC [Magnetococcales bacterium]|nr:flagellin FliC [Magnetococcales bacterium]
MSLTLYTNMAALQASRVMTRHTTAMGQSMRRLASGLRVENASDDAAGLSIIQRMSAQIRGANAAIRNVNDGISMLQVADGALEGTSDALQRIRELAVQASNDTLGDTDRISLSAEKDQLISEIQRIASQTTYNDTTLLNGISNAAYFQQQGGTTGGSRTSYQAVFQIGADAGQTVAIDMNLAYVSALGLGSDGSLASMLTQTGANTLIDRVDSALDSVSEIRANLGAIQNRFEAILQGLASLEENTQASRSRIRDADLALEAARLTRESILQQAGMAILAQANQQPRIVLQLLN